MAESAGKKHSSLGKFSFQFPVLSHRIPWIWTNSLTRQSLDFLMVKITIMTSTLERIASLESWGAEGMPGCLAACVLPSSTWLPAGIIDCSRISKRGLKSPPWSKPRVTGSFHCQMELVESALPKAPLPKKPPPRSSPLRAHQWSISWHLSHAWEAGVSA